MQIDKQPFPMNTLGLEGKKVLIQPEVARSANKNNVIVGEPRNNKESNKVLRRVVVLGKQPDGKETLKIIIRNPAFRGNPEHEKGLLPNSSSPRVQKSAGGRLTELKPSASASSQLSTCCCLNT